MSARFFRRLLLASFLNAAALLSTSAWADSTPKAKLRIAFVDVTRCVEETEDGLRARATLKKFSEKRNATLYIMEEKLQKQLEALQKLDQERKGAFDKNYIDAVTALDRNNIEFRQTMKKVQTELVLKEQELMKPLKIKLDQVFQRIGKDDSFDLILDRKAGPAYRAEFDITERVIREVNFGSLKKTSEAIKDPTTPEKSSKNSLNAPSVTRKASQGSPT